MWNDRSVRPLKGGAVEAQWGPMRLLIYSFVGKVPQLDMSRLAAEKAFECLRTAARLKKTLSSTQRDLQEKQLEPLARRMFESVRRVNDSSLTPLAAVAGTISDEVADFLFLRGMTKVIADNGGDIAVRLMTPHLVRVGIREDVNSLQSLRAVTLRVPSGKEGARFGIATSGLGGRSLTCGIASAATVIAETASVADAAATAIANASFVRVPGVVQKPAETVDPLTDIPSTPVTVGVKGLTRETRIKAVSQSLEKAESLVKENAILGAFVAVSGETGMTRFFKEHLI